MNVYYNFVVIFVVVVVFDIPVIFPHMLTWLFVNFKGPAVLGEACFFCGLVVDHCFKKSL